MAISSISTMDLKHRARRSRTSDISHNDKERSKEENMWSKMLDSVASGKKLPEKNILVLGGSPDGQKEFLEMLESDIPKGPQERNRRKPSPIANEFALGYTYQDVLDADQEDILARLSIYFLSEPLQAFAPLLKPKLTPRTIPDTLLVIFLDWAEPWAWIRQLRDWIVFLRGIISTLDEETKDAMEATMKDWQKRRRGGSAYEPSSGTTSNESNTSMPLSEGEWDEGLGLPLCVVCHSADRIDLLEREQGWREEEFDFILQFLRTILAKHGASLLYTSVSNPNSLPTMIHSTLGIHSLLKKQSLKHNVIDRDRILIPPNWDSWGKIRVLREGFDVDGISKSWSVDIQQPGPNTLNSGTEGTGSQTPMIGEISGTVQLYEDTIRDPRGESINDPNGKNLSLEIEVVKNQDFLAAQLEIMERLKVEEEKKKTPEKYQPLFNPSGGVGAVTSKPLFSDGRSITEHVGPIQFNLGGIQVDSAGMMKSSRDGEAKPKENEAPAPRMPETPGGPDGKAQNEALASFFAGLIKRGGANSPKSTST